MHLSKLAAGEDRPGLLGKVKSEEQLAALGGELYMSSVLLGEDAYDVQGGFLADVWRSRAAGPRPGFYPGGEGWGFRTVLGSPRRARFRGRTLTSRPVSPGGLLNDGMCGCQVASWVNTVTSSWD